MPKVQFVFLYTDVFIWALFALIVLYAVHAARTRELVRKWSLVLANRTAVACAAVLSVFFVLALVDSVHYRHALSGQPDAAQTLYSPRAVSLLDDMLLGRIAGRERSYSAPFALREFDKTTVLEEGASRRVHARLTGASPNLSEEGAAIFLMRRIEIGVMGAVLVLALFWTVLALVVKWARKTAFRQALIVVTRRDNPWRPAILVWQCALFAAALLMTVWPHFHVLGTDTTGNDVLYGAIKSVRTAIVIGSLATLSTLPFAVVLGIAAGYFKGWVDDVIQYVYTTVSSIPSVLLIAASVLMVQVFIDTHPASFATSLERSDIRLFLLAAIIGMTGWASLARLLRAETMKISAMDFVTAARAFGVSHARIMARHVLPNVAHIVLIVTVLDFSGIVLYEAVLSYVGVGVDPTMHSFGSMINAAAVEMSRSPVIWWNLAASFAFMFTLVLAANLFAGGVREAFDPRAARSQTAGKEAAS
ncbi:MAG: ABC transporter permease [Duodenibacillus sp.]|nr:ABC transporter permease [Duodenibacillus sp.]